MQMPHVTYYFLIFANIDFVRFDNFYADFFGLKVPDYNARFFNVYFRKAGTFDLLRLIKIFDSYLRFIFFSERISSYCCGKSSL